MSKRLVNTFTDGLNGDIVAKVYYDTEYSEYTVKMYYNGKHYEADDYFTNDKSDAFDTAKYAVAHNKIHTKHLKTNPVRKHRTTDDDGDARELLLFITDDANLYRQQTTPIIVNLNNRLAKGTYDAEKAVKLWQYLADNGAKLYNKENGDGRMSLSMFDKETRQIVARGLAEYYADELEPKTLAQSRLKRNPLPARHTNWKYMVFSVDTSQSIRVSNDICLVKEKIVANQIANCLNHFSASNKIVFRTKEIK